jgi:hypothetical protein
LNPASLKRFLRTGNCGAAFCNVKALAVIYKVDSIRLKFYYAHVSIAEMLGKLAAAIG